MTTARGEEALQELGGSCLADAAIDLRRVMAGRLREEARAMLDGAALWVWRTEIEPAKPREGDGRGAHGARLERDVEIAIDEPLAAEPGASLADGEELGMGGRIAKLKRAVAGFGQHLAGRAHHHGADGNLAQKVRGLGLGEGEIHGPLAWLLHICKRLSHHGGEIARKREARSRGEVRRGKGGGADAHRQGHRACRPLLAARRGAVDRRGPGRGQRHGAQDACPCREPDDKITVDGKPLPKAEAPRLWRYNKPKGLVTSHKDPQGRKTVFEALPAELPRVVSVGRLDLNTEGLLLLTTDGELARHLELPSTGWLRRYRVRAHGRVTQADLDRLAKGITIDGVHYGPVEAKIDREQGSNVWLTLGLREGKNREVKRLAEALGLTVNRLIRISFGPFALGDLPVGEVEEVKSRVLMDQLGAKLTAELGLSSENQRLRAARRR